MGTRLPLVLRQLRRPPHPPDPPLRLRVPCRASSGGGGGGGSGGREDLLGQRRLLDGQTRSSRSPGGRTPAARDSIVREVIQNSKEVLSLLQEKNPAFKPVLAIIQAGDDNLMQEINQNLAEETGLNITHICLPPDSSEAEIIDEILKINEDTRVHGLALQISENLFSNKVLNALKPEKDVDGVTDINLGKLVRGDAHECFVSPVAKAVIELLEKSAFSYLPRIHLATLQTGHYAHQRALTLIVVGKEQCLDLNAGHRNATHGVLPLRLNSSLFKGRSGGPESF
ncbi:hypothetical protein H8959_009521 [Pygathrix nigripes]